MARMHVFTEKSLAQGILGDSGGLSPEARGARVRLSRGKVTLTEAHPLPPSTGVVSGFAVVNSPSLGDAIGHAKEFLALAGDGETEIRLLFVPPGTPSRFLMLYRPEGPERDLAMPTPEKMAAMRTYVEASFKSGLLVTTGSLGPTSNGAQVRQAAGKVTVVDGPYAEAKELIAGYAVLIVPTLAAAIECSRPFLEIAGDGVCEIRQLH
jgi:hypothetical protein